MQSNKRQTQNLVDTGLTERLAEKVVSFYFGPAGKNFTTRQEAKQAIENSLQSTEAF